MRLSGPIEALASHVTRRATDARVGSGSAWDRDRAAFLALVPEHLRDALAARLNEPYGPDTEPLASWVTAPFARWAPPPALGYRLPEALVRWVLEPPRAFWFGHHCGTCGLAVPVRFTYANDPHPPPDLRPFPRCPGCGRETGYAASDRPDPVTPGAAT